MMIRADESRIQWRRVDRRSAKGWRYSTWEAIMPRITDELLKSVVYLFRDEESALSGKGGGGTGFLIQYIDDGGFVFWYVVSNLHVVNQGYRTLRVNGREGVIAIEIPPDDWTQHPDGDDIAVAPVDIEDHGKLAFSSANWGNIVGTPQRMEELDIGVGDDVFMLGRFSGHSGRQQNQPMARFGNLAMMDGEKVKDGRGMLIDAYLVEMRSLPGFSGSPVFVSIPPGSLRGAKTVTSAFGYSVGLLGIDTGHKKQVHRICSDEKATMPVDPPEYVEQNSGVAIVAPYYKIAEMIGGEELMDKREKAKLDPEIGVSDIAEDKPEDEHGRFEDLTGKLLKVPKKELDKKREEEKGGQ